MFCSRCGKTLMPEDIQCPACSHIVGESRFEGSPYTSAQSHIEPGQAPRDIPVPAGEEGQYENPSKGAYGTVTQDCTRTTYTSKGDEDVQGDEDARTSYRPVYEGASAPEEIRSDMRRAVMGEEENGEAEGENASAAIEPENLSEEARSTLNDMNEELRMESLDLSKFRSRPITSSGQTGISANVSEYISHLEAESQRRSSRRRPVYDEYEEVPADETAENPPVDEDQSEVFDDIDEEEFEELRYSGFGLKQVLKIAVALILVAALFVGGVMWFRNFKGKVSSAPIENVREALYNDGIALIESNASEEAITAMLQAYTAEGGGLTALTVQLSQATTAVNALTPEDATENELLFIDALKRIQANIGNCVTSDALALSQQDSAAVAESDERWKVVENSITMLKSARSAAELTAIINGEEISVVEISATPSPTPAVNYNTLSKGDKSDEVLDMQNRLYELGFLLDDRDGAFGNNTMTAVKMFQQMAGLPITGIADAETLAAMYADDAPRTEFAQPTPTPSPNA